MDAFHPFNIGVLYWLYPSLVLPPIVTMYLVLLRKKLYIQNGCFHPKHVIVVMHAIGFERVSNYDLIMPFSRYRLSLHMTSFQSGCAICFLPGFR